MATTATKKKEEKILVEKKRTGLDKRFGQPQFILEQMAEYIKDGDFASITDLVGAYITNSPKYKNQEQFAQSIGTTRQTLYRMLSHDEAVGLRVFFGAVEQISNDRE